MFSIFLTVVLEEEPPCHGENDKYRDFNHHSQTTPWLARDLEELFGVQTDSDGGGLCSGKEEEEEGDEVLVIDVVVHEGLLRWYWQLLRRYSCGDWGLSERTNLAFMTLESGMMSFHISSLRMCRQEGRERRGFPDKEPRHSRHR